MVEEIFEFDDDELIPEEPLFDEEDEETEDPYAEFYEDFDDE